MLMATPNFSIFYFNCAFRATCDTHKTPFWFILLSALAHTHTHRPEEFKVDSIPMKSIKVTTTAVVSHTPSTKTIRPKLWRSTETARAHVIVHTQHTHTHSHAQATTTEWTRKRMHETWNRIGQADRPSYITPNRILNKKLSSLSLFKIIYTKERKNLVNKNPKAE